MLISRDKVRCGNGQVPGGKGGGSLEGMVGTERLGVRSRRHDGGGVVLAFRVVECLGQCVRPRTDACTLLCEKRVPATTARQMGV